MLVLTDDIIDWLKNTAGHLKGSARRLFMAETVQQLGYGGASAAEKNWDGIEERSKKDKKNLQLSP